MRKSVRVWAGLPSVAQQLQARRSKLFNLLCAMDLDQDSDQDLDLDLGPDLELDNMKVK